MDHLHARLEALESQVHTLHQQAHAVDRRLRWWRGIACGLGVLSFLSWTLQAVTAGDGQVLSIPDRFAALERKLAPLTFDAATNEVVITGANLRLLNGLGSTETTNGLGNLIVGYNERGGGETAPVLQCRRVGGRPAERDSRGVCLRQRGRAQHGRRRACRR
jgi:hypothetical protein